MQTLVAGNSGSLRIIQILGGVFPKDVYDLILGQATLLKVPHRYLIQEINDDATGFYFVLTGAIKLTKIDKETHALIDVIGPTECFGLPLIMSEQMMQKYPVQVESLGNSELLLIPKETYHQSLKTSESFSTYAALQIKKRIDRLQCSTLVNMLPVEKRIADFVLERLIKIPNIRITRLEIAQAIGSTQESVTRILSKWAALGILKIESRAISHCDRVALEQIRKN